MCGWLGEAERRALPPRRQRGRSAERTIEMNTTIERTAVAGLASAHGSPRRIQLKRTKGWRMPPNTVNCARPARWGNPFKIIAGSVTQASNLGVVHKYEQWLTTKNVLAGGGWDEAKPTIEEIRRELGGKNLACWCNEGNACHADILLGLANPDAKW